MVKYVLTSPRRVVDGGLGKADVERPFVVARTEVGSTAIRSVGAY